MEREYLYGDALAGIPSAKLELQERANRVSKQNRTILHTASQDGSIQQVQYILKEFASNNFLGKLDSNKETALHAAVSYGRIEVVRGLIDAAKYWPTSVDHVDPTSSVRGYKNFIRQANEGKNTALHLALKNGYWDIAKLLVEADLSYSHIQNSEGESPIYLAAKSGYNQLVKMICKGCEAPTVYGPEGTTALHFAIMQQLPEDQRDVVEVLIQSAKRALSPTAFEAFLRQSDDNEDTALHLAVQRDYLDVVELILAEDPRFPQEHRNKDLKTAVYIAAEEGYKDIVELLCRKSPSGYTTPGPKNQTALHVAIIRRRTEKKEDEIDMVEVLIKAAKRELLQNKFEAFIREADDDDDTALHLAAQKNYIDVVKLIIETDPNFPQDHINKDLKTAVYIAAEKGYKDIVQILCRNSPSGYMTPGPKNQTALHVAIIGRHTDTVRCLLWNWKEGCSVTLEDHIGWTPLHYAAQQKFDSVLSDIISMPEYIYVNKDKVTPPLCIAAHDGHTSTVTELMRLLPAVCAHVDSKGQNMLHIAANNSDKDTIVSILKNCPTKSLSKVMNDKDHEGNTPLHILIRQGCFVPELLNHKGIEDQMATNNQNYTPLDMLYFKDEIIADQLRIKNATEDTQLKQHWKFWQWNFCGGRIERKLNTQESAVPPRKRAKKDEEFNKANRKLMQEELKFYRQRTNTQIIVTALITTVTFTVGFTLPGGYYQSGDDDGGLALLSTRAAFNAFMVTDTLALALSTTSLFLYFISTMYQDPHKVSKFNCASTVLNIVSVIAMMLTFLTGTYVVLSKSRALAITVCAIICIFFLIVIVLLIQMLCDREDRKMEKTHEV